VNIFKNVLLLMLTCLFPMMGNAELIGGHDRQRLTLIYLDELSKYYQTFPIQLNIPELPIIVHQNSPNAEQMLPLMMVLVEEGWLESEQRVVNAADKDNEIRMTRAFEFQYKPGQAEKPITYGEIKVISIKKIKDIPSSASDEAKEVEVIFEWRLFESAEWLWASALNAVADIGYLKEATEHLKTGSAIFKWQRDQWQLTKAPALRVP